MITCGWCWTFCILRWPFRYQSLFPPGKSKLAGKKGKKRQPRSGEAAVRLMRCVFIPLLVRAACECTCAEGRAGWPRVVNNYSSRAMFLTLRRLLNKERVLPCLDISCRLFCTYYSLFSATFWCFEQLFQIYLSIINLNTQVRNEMVPFRSVPACLILLSLH